MLLVSFYFFYTPTSTHDYYSDNLLMGILLLIPALLCKGARSLYSTLNVSSIQLNKISSYQRHLPHQQTVMLYSVTTGHSGQVEQIGFAIASVKAKVLASKAEALASSRAVKSTTCTSRSTLSAST